MNQFSNTGFFNEDDGVINNVRLSLEINLSKSSKRIVDASIQTPPYFSNKRNRIISD